MAQLPKLSFSRVASHSRQAASSRAASLRLVRPRLMQVGKPRALSSDEGREGMFYNSQLGQWIRKSGAAGIRVHDVTVPSRGWSDMPELLAQLVITHPTTVELGNFSGLSDTQLQELAAGAAKPKSAGLQISAGVEDVEALARWAAFAGLDASQKMSSISLSCRAESPEEELAGAKDLVAASHDAGIQVKARIQDAFTDADGETTDPYTVHDMVLGLADAGTDVLIVTDSFVRATEDEVIEMMEALLWFDVAGESMMERLGFRGGLDGSLAAAKLGVTHFEAAVLHSDADFVGARTLAEALSEAGKQVALDWKNL